MRALLKVLDHPSPVGLDDVGGAWDCAILGALVDISNTISGEASLEEFALGVDRGWALLGWVEASATWWVRQRSAEIIHQAELALFLLWADDFDRREMSITASVLKNAILRTEGPESSELKWSREGTLSREFERWLKAVPHSLPPTHEAFSQGETFELRRVSTQFDAEALEQRLVDSYSISDGSCRAE